MTAVNPLNQIVNFEPQSWDDILGNRTIREYFKDMIYNVRVVGRWADLNALVIGAPRTGKSASILYGMKCLGCFNLNFETLDACGTCASCQGKQYKYGNREWEHWCSILSDDEAPTPIEFHYAPVDCTTLDVEGIKKLTIDLEANEHILNVIYLDEIHRLCSRNMDEKLLIPMDKFPAIWIASSAYADRKDGSSGRPLEKMLQNRFTYRLPTEKPTDQELAIWTARQCKRIGITVEDPKSTLNLLAQRCDRIPGMAIAVLRKAFNKREKILTRKLLDEHVFDFDDGVIA